MANVSAKSIEYVYGDATDPRGDGLKVIVHCCNSIGLWGAGFVVALSKKNTVPEKMYRAWYKDAYYSSEKVGDVPFRLGRSQLVPFGESTLVCNIIGQEGVGFKNGPPIRYEAIRSGINMMREVLLKNEKFSVHMPRMGCGLAGGEWPKMEVIIKETLCDYGIPVTVYDFLGK